MRPSRKFYHILLILVLLLLLIPVLPIGHIFSGLKEYEGDKDSPELNKESWFSGDYQKQWDDHARSDINFADFLGSLNNEINYRVFDKFPDGPEFYQRYILGKDESIFMGKHINSVLGLDSIGKSYIESKVRKLKCVQDSLEKRGTKLLFIINASRGRTLYDQIPDNYTRKACDVTNYDYFKHYLKAYNVNTLDAIQYFEQIQDTYNYKLFPKQGLHLCKMPEFLYIDTLISSCEHLLGKPMRRFKVTDKYKMLATEKIQYDNGSGAVCPTERELMKNVKFLWGPQPEELWYPKVELDTVGKKPHSKALVISDSFFITAFNCGILKKVFKDGKMCFYNKQQFIDGRGGLPDQTTENLLKEVEDYDLLIFGQTESNLAKAGYNAIDPLYIKYCVPKEEQEKERKIAKQEAVIKSVSEWFTNLQKVAKKENKPFVKVLRENAIYILKSQGDL